MPLPTARIPDEIFKAYDIRGIVETALTPQVVTLIGKALGSAAQDAGSRELAIGRDGRLTGPALCTALCEGILSTGCDVVEIGQVPTPALYFAAQKLTAGSGIQITGSHNPPPYNGLKMMIAGVTLCGEAITDLRRRIGVGDYRRGTGRFREVPILDDYCDAMVHDVALNRSLKVVLDCGNGVAGACAPGIFRRIGCDVTELFCEVDGSFPNHHADPSQPENLQDLIAKVQETDAHFGMAFDGDGDRLGVVTASGDVVWPDRQMVLFARAILEQQPAAEIIYDVKCSQVLHQEITVNGGVATMWKTGHSFIKQKLRESGAALAGEMSGHIFFNDRWAGFDDGIYAGARLCELISKADTTATAVFDSIPDTVNTPELRLETAEGEQHTFVDKLVAAAKFDDAKVSTIDGLRVDFEDGFGLIRASNTTPTVIMRFEAVSESRLQAIKSRFREFVASIHAGMQLPF